VAHDRFQRFSCFCRAHQYEQQTDRQTDRQTTVATARIYHCLQCGADDESWKCDVMSTRRSTTPFNNPNLNSSFDLLTSGSRPSTDIDRAGRFPSRAPTRRTNRRVDFRVEFRVNFRDTRKVPTKYPRTTNRTKKYQSFISFALNNYQTS